MKYTVVILPRAKWDFQQLHDFIKQRSTRGAASWANAFYRALKRLEKNPLSCQLAPESETADSEVHQLLFRTRRGNQYRALFSVREDRVYVRHLRGPGQDYAANLDEIELPPTD